jgi:hypothetical protein
MSGKHKIKYPIVFISAEKKGIHSVINFIHPEELRAVRKNKLFLLYRRCTNRPLQEYTPYTNTPMFDYTIKLVLLFYKVIVKGHFLTVFD